MQRIRTSAGHLAGLWASAALVLGLLFPCWHLLLRAAPACTFRAVTGLPCLTCGTSRSILALTRGNIALALASNPLAVFALSTFFLGGIFSALWLLGAWPRAEAPSHSTRRMMILGIVVLLVVNWAYLLFSHV